MRIINISLNEFLCFKNDQDVPNNNNPMIRNTFSLKLKLLKFLKKKQYVKVREIINNGTTFEVINIKMLLNLLESNKYFIPTKVFSVRMDEICKG